MIRVRALAQSAIEVKRTTISPESEMVFAALLILCVDRGRRVEREALVGLLWPRETATRRRHNLRQVLYKLRRLGVDPGGTSEALSLPRSQVWLDFEDAALDGELGASVGSGPGLRLLPGYTPRWSKPFAEWLGRLRERFDANIRRQLVDAIGAARRENRWVDVERLARMCLDVDPLNEEATLALAESVALSGAKSTALSILDTYVAELGVDAPDLRVQATILRRRIADRIAPTRVVGPLETKLIGREDILGTLTAALDNARAGRAQTHVIWGASGIGKTRVLDEISRLAVVRGGRVFSQHAAADDAQTPGLSLMRLLRVMMDAPGALGLAPDVLSLLRQIAAQSPGEERSQPTDLGEDALVRALVDLERALAWESFLTIVVDDLHNADALSRRVIARAQGCLTTEPVLLISAGIPRPEQGSLGAAVVHELGRLSDAETHQYANALFEQAGEVAPATAVEALVAASGGHPFLLREATVAWLRGGRDAARSSLDSLLRRRITALSAEARDLLLTVLLLGEHASVPLLMTSAAPHTAQVERALVELEQEQIANVSSNGTVRTHSLWVSSIDHLVPTSLAVARRHRVAQLLEEAAHATSATAELLLASAAHFERAGDSPRASAVLAKSGAALNDRALAPGASAAYSRAAVLTPASDDFDACLAQAIFSAWQARLVEEVEPLLSRIEPRLKASSRLSTAERNEMQVIELEASHSALGDVTGERCLGLLKSGGLTPQQQLRVAVVGAQAAHQDYAFETVGLIADFVASIADRPPESNAARQVAIVHAISTRRLSDACRIAETDLLSISGGIGSRDRCRRLIGARVPFVFDGDSERVEEIIKLAREALRTYSCTVDALRVEDIYATHCLDQMRLREADNILSEVSELSNTFGFSGILNSFAELRVRLDIARREPRSIESALAALEETGSRPGCLRRRTFALSNAVISLARASSQRELADPVDELRSHYNMIATSSPFDYAYAGLAIGLHALGHDQELSALSDSYRRTVRIASFPPSPFILSILADFGLDWS